MFISEPGFYYKDLLIWIVNLILFSLIVFIWNHFFMPEQALFQIVSFEIKNLVTIWSLLCWTNLDPNRRNSMIKASKENDDKMVLENLFFKKKTNFSCVRNAMTHGCMCMYVHRCVTVSDTWRDCRTSSRPWTTRVWRGPWMWSRAPWMFWTHSGGSLTKSPSSQRNGWGISWKSSVRCCVHWRFEWIIDPCSKDQ